MLAIISGGETMKRIQIERPKYRRGRAEFDILPRDPRDPDVVRVKSLGRVARTRREANKG
jgi:hypothetical protein